MTERRALRARDGRAAAGATPGPPERQRASEDDTAVWVPTYGVGTAGPLCEIDWTRGEKVPPWRQPLGFAPPEGRTPRCIRTLVVITGYRPRGPR